MHDGTCGACNKMSSKPLVEGFPDAVVTRFIFNMVRKWPGTDHGRNAVRVKAAMHTITTLLHTTSMDIEYALGLARSMNDLKNVYGENLEQLPADD